MDRLSTLRGLETTPHADPLQQFREDFGAVWKWRRHCGYISQDELRDGMKQEGDEMKANMHDKEWIESRAAQFASDAAQMRSDLARSDRIRAEVRAEREAA